MFLAVCNVVDAFRNTRILQIGPRPFDFWSTMCNEGELLEKDGICASVADVYCLKPLNEEKILRAAERVKVVYVLGASKIRSEFWNLMAVDVSVLSAAGICIMMYFQVEQIGWCVAGLDEWGILTSFFIALVLAVAGLAVSLVGCFADQN